VSTARSYAKPERTLNPKVFVESAHIMCPPIQNDSRSIRFIKGSP
jgi:hypothetical protein